MQIREGFRLGELIVGPAAEQVLRPDGPQRVPARAAEALLVLAEQSNRVVSRELLSTRLWPGGAGSDEALVRCIGELRHALGDSGKDHRYLQTVARQGYRLMVEPTALSPADRAQLLQVPRPLSRERDSWWMRLLPDVRARRTVPVVLGSAGIAWGAMQFADLIVARFPLPESIARFVIIFGILGLPVAAALAWFYRPTAPGGKPYFSVPRIAGGGVLLVGVALAITWYFAPARLPGPQSPPPPPERSIVVLPFDNFSGDASVEYFGDGLADEIANRLTRVPGLAVASRTTAFTYKGSKLGAKGIAAELGVRHVLEGSLRRQGDTLRITTQLIDGPTESHVWSKTYERRQTRDFDVEDDISGAVLEALKIVLSPEQLEKLSKRPTADYDAYEAYRKGISVLRSASAAPSLDEAAQLFKDALLIDPTFAEAHAALCETDVKRYTFLRAPQSLKSAENSCAQAVRLDSGLPEVHLALGMLYSANGQLTDAEREYRKAVELKPEFVEAHLGLASALAATQRYDAAEATYQAAIKARPRYWLCYDKYGTYEVGRGRAAAAVPLYRRATELAPLNASVHSNLGVAYLLLGDFASAATAFRRSVEIAPTSEGYSNTGTMYFYAGRPDEAAAMFEQATALTPQDYIVWGNLADAYRYSSDRVALAGPSYVKAEGLARAQLGVNPDDRLVRTQLAYYLARQGDLAAAGAELAQVSLGESTNLYVHYYAALVHIQIGDPDAAIEQLTLAVEQGFPRYVLRAAPELDGLQADPRLAGLLDDPGNGAAKAQTKKGGS